MKKSKIIPLICITLISGMISSGCAKKQEQPVEEKTTAVEVIQAGNNTIENTFVYTGTIKPAQEVDVFSTVQGKVKEVYFDIGDTVKEGDVLFQMNTEDLENALNVANASLASAQASVASAQTSLELVNGASMQTQIDSAKTSLVNAEIAYNQAKTSYENSKSLYAAGAISKDDMDKATDGYKQAETAYNQAKNYYQSISVDIPAENERKALDGLNIAKAAQASAQAQIETYQKQIRDSAVKSPISGVVTACNVTEGELLSSANVPFTVINADNVEIDVSVSDQIVNDINVGDKVDVNISSIAGKVFEGSVKTVNPAANSGGTYDVTISIENKNNELKSGMFGEVNFIKEKSESSIVLPRNAVLLDGETQYVYVEENGVAVRKDVQTGIDTGESIEILSGIQTGENVIVKGQTFIDDGEKVTVSSSEKEE